MGHYRVFVQTDTAVFTFFVSENWDTTVCIFRWAVPTEQYQNL